MKTQTHSYFIFFVSLFFKNKSFQFYIQNHLDTQHLPFTH